ncbi:MAG: tRNA 4-thiouridine(8) synthase ThiI [Clostridiales Family XIII bacterium]|jgi:thiamine biosynthesis protein ThiI|nr:tRNA 4-thiouridine(8) synthase ThiI [Clostridiales Family XIII bacterium]
MNTTQSPGTPAQTEHVLIVRYGEVALKGMNKPYFERVLMGRIQSAIKKEPEASELRITREDGLIVVQAQAGQRTPLPERLMHRIAKVFGVATISPAIFLPGREMEDIFAACIAFIRDKKAERSAVSGEGTPISFKVFGKRSDKTYPIPSPEMSAKIGEAILAAFAPAVKVDVHNPDVRLNVHLRRKGVFIFDEKVSCFGGLPLGTNGKGMILLSGGIDSPVAAWMMARRGMRIEAVHYHSYPYTSQRAQEKVEELAQILASYCGSFTLHVVNLLPAQERIALHCPEELMTILVRRFMMKIAEKIAGTRGCGMLITGENLGQVASQTAEALITTDAAVSLPVMRPLIAFDKTEIIEKAQEIGTFEKSIEPYEDCCTVFLPKHPATRPKPETVLAAENAIPDVETLIEELIATKEIIRIGLENDEIR